MKRILRIAKVDEKDAIAAEEQLARSGKTRYKIPRIGALPKATNIGQSKIIISRKLNRRISDDDS
jgi:hypothetical protein